MTLRVLRYRTRAAGVIVDPVVVLSTNGGHTRVAASGSLGGGPDAATRHAVPNLRSRNRAPLPFPC